MLLITANEEDNDDEEEEGRAEALEIPTEEEEEATRGESGGCPLFKSDFQAALERSRGTGWEVHPSEHASVSVSRVSPSKSQLSFRTMEESHPLIRSNPVIPPSYIPGLEASSSSLGNVDGIDVIHLAQQQMQQRMREEYPAEEAWEPPKDAWVPGSGPN